MTANRENLRQQLSVLIRGFAFGAVAGTMFARWLDPVVVNFAALLCYWGGHLLGAIKSLPDESTGSA